MLGSKAVKLVAILAITTFAFGCASKKFVKQQVTPVQSQLAVLTDEVAKLDEAIQDMRGQAAAAPSGMSARSHSDGARVSGGVYRTPSGFELPSVDIQRALKGAGFYHGNVDGKVGPATEAAIRAFQEANGLDADGICGRNTWEKLKQYLSTVK